MNILGIDLGGTKIALTKYQLPDWKVIQELTSPTPTAEGVDAVVLKIVELINSLRDKDTKAIGIGMPGPVNDGCIEKFPNISGAENFCLEKSLETHLKIPVKIENDANCFIVGAWQKSEHKDKKNILGITIGTGVGGGLIIDGKLVRGKNGAAGEFGHMILRDGISFQDLNSGKALSKRWQESFEESKTGKEIVELAKSGDEKSIKFLEKIGKDLGIAISNLISALNPEVIFIGGSAAAAYPLVEKSVQKVLQDQRFPSTVDIPIIAIAETEFATFGAAWLAQ